MNLEVREKKKQNINTLHNSIQNVDERGTEESIEEFNSDYEYLQDWINVKYVNNVIEKEAFATKFILVSLNNELDNCNFDNHMLIAGNEEYQVYKLDNQYRQSIDKFFVEKLYNGYSFLSLGEIRQQIAETLEIQAFQRF